MKFTRPEDEGIKLSDLVKRFLFIFFSIMVILAGITAVLFISSARNELSIIENHEIKNISTVSRLVIKGFDSAISDVIFLNELSTSFISGQESKTQLFEAISSFLKSKNYYQKIILANADGKILIEIRTQDRELTLVHSASQNLKNNLDFKNTMATGRGHVYVSDFQLEEGIPVLVFGTPVVDQYKKKKAALLISYNCKPIFEIFKWTFELPEEKRTKVSNYFIIDADGYWIKGPKPEDEFGFLYSTKREKRFGYVFPEAWEKITKDQTGQIFIKDGLFTFTTFYPLARAEKASQQTADEFENIVSGNIRSFDRLWKIISFVPRNICTIQSTTRLKEFLMYDLVLLLFFIIVSWIIARITLKKEYAERVLEHLSVTDPLTGLYNRRGFFLLAEQQLKIAERVNQHMVLFYIDLDDFKNINDALGHQEGDIALIKTADVLKTTFRQADIIGRVGGDEFLTLVIQDSPADIDSILRRMQSEFETENSKIKDYKLQASVGFALYKPGQKLTIDNLISIADRMMYSNKRIRKKSS
ncbi:MAG: sensor domain-containing diguanylate cyclase [Candidatus Omnitrophica bacterium]|nr:sensor domain-containing diguanylate cyclase [Candidatus Omnitrophota bacterium]MCM8828372.1 sensor domain-containing diguanylate cyclase [Candidatus Omnitrophota bacterium]